MTWCEHPICSRRRALSLGLGAVAGLALGTATPARAQAPLFSPQSEVVPIRQPDPAYDADVGLDPGHSLADPGASGAGVGELVHTLDVAFRLKPLLESAGLRVTLSRTDHQALSDMSHRSADERTRIEQSARIAAVGRVRIYVSLHFNGVDGAPSVRGAETYFNPENAGAESWRLAEAVQRHMVAAIRDFGYPVIDRGAKEDLAAGKPYGHFFGLRGGMPSIYGEPLFLSNPTEAALLLREEARDAVARGYAGGILEYFAAATLPATP